MHICVFYRLYLPSFASQTFGMLGVSPEYLLEPFLYFIGYLTFSEGVWGVVRKIIIILYDAFYQLFNIVNCVGTLELLGVNTVNLLEPILHLGPF